MDFYGEDEENEQFHELAGVVSERFEEIGLYVTAVMLQSADPDATIEEQIEDESVFLRAQFRIGEVAWSDRVLNPEAHADAREFALAAPTEEEILLQKLIDEAKTGELFDLDGEDENPI